MTHSTRRCRITGCDLPWPRQTCPAVPQSCGLPNLAIGCSRREHHRMRELIYLSENKLQRFQAERSAGLWRRIRQVEVKAPLGTGVNVGLSDPIAKSHPDLAKVLKHIDRSDSPARWFEEEGLEPGEWVKFEARLNYVIYSEVVERYDQKGTLRPSPTPPPPPLFSGNQSRTGEIKRCGSATSRLARESGRGGSRGPAGSDCDNSASRFCSERALKVPIPAAHGRVRRRPAR